MKILDLLLQIIGIASAAAAPLLGGSGSTANAINSIAGALVRIAQMASKAHEDITGKPIDLELLKTIEPVP